MIKNFTVGILIPTFNASHSIDELFLVLKKTSIVDKILVIDSNSADETITLCQKYNIEFVTINQNEFNHGATREVGRNLLKTDIVVMLTQDIKPINEMFIEIIIEPIINGEVVATYGRQISNDDADVFESFPREYNYPNYSIIKNESCIQELGVFTYFFSDSFAAYKNSILDEIGGFKPILTHEDYFAVAEIMERGHSIKYVADAVIKHSHRYNLMDDFKRSFDTGFVRGENIWVQKKVGKAESRGMDFTLLLLKKILKEKPYLILYGIVQAIVKAVGYKVGYHCTNAPVWLNKLFSGQKYYWSSVYYLKGKE